MANESILWFKDISKKDIKTVGGKGANLGELYSKVSIPNGFCITVKVFEDFLDKCGISQKLNDLLNVIDAKDAESTEIISNKIKKLIGRCKFPSELKKNILDSYSKLNGFVAVRSSATAEDLDEASFAGQQDTYLNVKGEKEIFDSVKKCWASFYNSRAIVYRVQNGFDHDPKICVVIQEMVDAKKSGVLFTANPINKNNDEMIIEATFGLGEALVSGIVTPDHFLYDKKKKKVVKEIINEKNVAIKKVKGKTKKLKLGSKESNERTLSAKEINELVKYSLLIEKHYKKPMDIEWAIDDKLYILQARAITTL